MRDFNQQFPLLLAITDLRFALNKTPRHFVSPEIVFIFEHASMHASRVYAMKLTRSFPRVVDVAVQLELVPCRGWNSGLVSTVERSSVDL